MARTNRRLPELVKFQGPNPDAQSTQDGWLPGFTTNAGYVRLRGGEEVQGRRLAGVQPTVITVRNYPSTQAVGTDWRVVDERTGEVFNIRSRQLTPDRTHWEFLTESGVAV